MQVRTINGGDSSKNQRNQPVCNLVRNYHQLTALNLDAISKHVALVLFLHLTQHNYMLMSQ